MWRRSKEGKFNLALVMVINHGGDNCSEIDQLKKKTGSRKKKEDKFKLIEGEGNSSNGA